MERLTQKRFDGNYEWHCAKCAENCRRGIACENCEELGGIIDRLGAVEDILGDDYDLARLRELMTADKDGRCFVSDVNLGGEVFYIPKFNGKPYCGIQTGHVQAVAFTKAGKRIKIREHHAHNQDFMIGKTVFLTREAARAALAEKGERDG